MQVITICNLHFKHLQNKIDIFFKLSKKKMGFIWNFIRKSCKNKQKMPTNYTNDTLSKETTQNEMEKSQNKKNEKNGEKKHNFCA